MRRRALFAWELGGGLGHIFKLLPVADGLADAGHDVVMAMRDVVSTRGVLGQRSHRVIAAPIPVTVPKTQQPLVSWADLLLYSGYTATDSIRFLIAAWLDLFRRERPDVLVTDFAPAAMLAARVAGLRVVSIGNGWTLPPKTVPLPSMQPWMDVPPAVLQAADFRALGSLNAALIWHGTAPLPSLAALFQGTDEYLCCFPELDHYSGRENADYYGAIYQADAGVEPAWPARPGPRVFAYLSTRGDRARAVLGALERLAWPAVVYDRNRTSGAAPASVWYAPGPVRLDAVLAERPIVICAGLNMTSAALISGCPVLSLPDHQEQDLLAFRVGRQGLGVAAAPHDGADAVTALLRRLNEDPGFAARAAGLAASYDGYHPGMAVAAIVADIETLLSGS